MKILRNSVFLLILLFGWIGKVESSTDRVTIHLGTSYNGVEVWQNGKQLGITPGTFIVDKSEALILTGFIRTFPFEKSIGVIPPDTFEEGDVIQLYFPFSFDDYPQNVNLAAILALHTVIYFDDDMRLIVPVEEILDSMGSGFNLTNKLFISKDKTYFAIKKEFRDFPSQSQNQDQKIEVYQRLGYHAFPQRDPIYGSNLLTPTLKKVAEIIPERSLTQFAKELYFSDDGKLILYGLKKEESGFEYYISRFMDKPANALRLGHAEDVYDICIRNVNSFDVACQKGNVFDFYRIRLSEDQEISITVDKRVAVPENIRVNYFFFAQTKLLLATDGSAYFLDVNSGTIDQVFFNYKIWAMSPEGDHFALRYMHSSPINYSSEKFFFYHTEGNTTFGPYTINEIPKNNLFFSFISPINILQAWNSVEDFVIPKIPYLDSYQEVFAKYGKDNVSAKEVFHYYSVSDNIYKQFETGKISISVFNGGNNFQIRIKAADFKQLDWDFNVNIDDMITGEEDINLPYAVTVIYPKIKR